jgi:hypothetical protein
VVSFPSVVFSVVIDRFNDERLRRKEQALCAAYLSLKNRELQTKRVVQRFSCVARTACGTEKDLANVRTKTMSDEKTIPPTTITKNITLPISLESFVHRRVKRGTTTV